MSKKNLRNMLALAVASSVGTQASIITFEDCTVGPLESYAGFVWNGFQVGDTSTLGGGVIGDRAAYTIEAQASVADGLFNFSGALLTSAYAGYMEIYLTGYDSNNSIIATHTSAMDPGQSSWVAPESFLGLSKIVFSMATEDGDPAAFVLDNFSYEMLSNPDDLLPPLGNGTPVPDGGSAAMLLGLGLGAMGAIRRRSR